MAFALKAAPSLQARPAARRLVSRRAGRASAVVVRAAKAEFPRDWLKLDPIVLGAGFLGWTIPSSIGVSGFGGESLFSLFNASIASNLAKFPTGPQLDDPFWLYMITWHVGLFVTLLLGRVGVEGRKQGYW